MKGKRTSTPNKTLAGIAKRLRDYAHGLRETTEAFPDRR
jgi:hypothetical protein